MKIEIYSKPNCPFCDKAKLLLMSRKMVYEEYMLGVHFTRETLLEKFATAKTFPVVVIDGFYIGGFNQLNEVVESQKNGPIYLSEAEFNGA